MDSYTISGVFAQTMAKYGLFMALMAVCIIALVAVAAYYAKNRIDIMRAESGQMESLISSLMTGLDEARKQNMRIIENHLTHDSQERQANISFMTKLEAKEDATVGVINQLAESVKKSADDSYNRAKAVYEQLAKLNSGIEVLKDRR